MLIQMREILLPTNGLLFKLKFDKLLGRFRTQNVSTYTKYTVETQQLSTGSGRGIVWFKNYNYLL